MSIQHTDTRQADDGSDIPEPTDADNGRKGLSDLLWWVTLEEFDRWVNGDLSFRELGEIAVDRADGRGAMISPDLRDDEWYEEYQKTGRIQQ